MLGLGLGWAGGLGHHLSIGGGLGLAGGAGGYALRYL